MKSIEIRKKFIEYFQKNNHQYVKSSSLVPHNDPTLLFNNAGMNQFKETFLGHEKREYSRAVSSQKCVRAGGKHNDLENVGFTARHHTFFEMLGNFSFGDYFKEEAISFAWSFLTKELGLPKDKLYVTVFETDDEAFNIWHQQENIPKDRIYRFGEKDNFWRMGNVGPCGPSSEIFYDFGDEIGGNPADNVMGGEGDRFMEIWNLVFMQYFENEKGEQIPLPKPSIDTGGGLERFATVLQKKLNNYDTDLFLPLIETASSLSGHHYKTGSKDPSQQNLNTALRVLADHSRSCAFLMADGVTPSNEGRGYVLRRIMRRAIRYGHKLSEQESLLPKTVKSVIETMGTIYPELTQHQKQILSACEDEEIRFKKTLSQGTEILTSALNQLKKGSSKTLPGEVSFKLYDTYGFPIDLTRVMANESGFEVNEQDFKKFREEAQSKARGSWKGSGNDKLKVHLSEASQELKEKTGPTQFVGYNFNLNHQASPAALSNGHKMVSSLEEGQSGYLAFTETSFYAESGGQCGDRGRLYNTNSKVEVEVLDCKKILDIHWLEINVSKGTLNLNLDLTQEVTSNDRLATTSNHSATHLLHAALRSVLGEHIRQAGSLVDPDKLRFDFTHNKPLTQKEILNIENLVNKQISLAIETKKEEMTYDQAISSGAMALFGEKYGDKVRVLRFGDFSVELCGGTHVNNTAMIRLFKIVGETGVSSGVRRIEALTHDKALSFLAQNSYELFEIKNKLGIQEHWNQTLETQPKDSKVLTWMDKKNQEVKDLQKKLKSSQTEKVNLDDFVNQAVVISDPAKDFKLVWAKVEQDDRGVLGTISDHLKNKIDSGVIFTLGESFENKPHPITVAITQDLTPKIKAGDLLKALNKVLECKGGGRPNFAQGTYKSLQNLAQAKQVVVEILSQ